MAGELDMWKILDMRVAGTSWQDIGNEVGADWRTVKKNVTKHIERLKRLEEAAKIIRTF